MTRQDLDTRFREIASELQGLPEPSRVTGYDPANAARTLGAATKALALIDALKSNKDVFYEKLNKELETPEVARPSFCLAIVEAARDHYVSGFDRLRDAILSEAFDDLLSMAEHLHRDGFHLAAVSLCGGVLEDTLRKLYTSHVGNIAKRDSGINFLNEGLKSQSVYNQPQWSEIRSWGDLRNDVDHGRLSNSEDILTVDESGRHHDVIDPTAVARMIDGIRSFMSKYLG
ncbi:MAG: hypothetical protein ABFE08_04370 [Armatimonadia bacterium]